MQLFFSLPKSSSIQRHFSAILVKKPTTKMNSIAFTQNDIVLQLQLQLKPWKLLHTITDKTQVSFRQFAWGDFHAHLLASLTLISMKKKNYSAIARRKNIPFYYIATDEIPGFFLSLKNHIFIAPSEIFFQTDPSYVV